MLGRVEGRGEVQEGLQLINLLQTLTVGNETVQCYIAVGVSPPVAVACGDIYGKYLGLRSDTASVCTGASLDTCISRDAANVWTFNAGTSLRVPGYVSAGTWNTTSLTNAQSGDTLARRVWIGNVGAPLPFDDVRRGSLALNQFTLVDTRNTAWYMTQLQNTFLFGTGATMSTLYNLFSQSVMSVNDSTLRTVSQFGNAYTNSVFYGPLSFNIASNHICVASFRANASVSITNWRGYYPTFTVTAGASVNVTTYTELLSALTAQSGLSVANYYPFRVTSTIVPTVGGAAFSTAEILGPKAAAFLIDSNSATCGAGLVAGTAFDTCLYRGRAGAWTGPAGTDIYTDSGYICAGAGCSSVTSTNTGVYDAGVRVMSSVSCTGATCSLTNGALSVTVTGTTSATVSASITGGGSCGGSVSVLGSWSNMRVTLITGTGPGCSVPGDDVFQVVRGTACGSSGVPVCNISPADDVSPPLTWNGPSGSGTTRIARTPSYGSTLSVSTTYYYDIRCGCTTD